MDAVKWCKECGHWNQAECGCKPYSVTFEEAHGAPAGENCAPLTGYLNALPRIRNADGSLKHIIREGSREHVISYSNKGQHCSEPECEINRQHSDNLAHQ